MTLISNKFFLKRFKMPEFLDELENIDDSSAASLYIPPDLTVPEIEDLLQKTGVQPVPDELSQLTARSTNGVVIFWGSIRKCLVLPPFPLKERVIFAGHVTEPLQLLLSNDFIIGIVLVRLGAYAVGVCKGENLITSKVGTGLIHGRHKKGGSSQQRFQRRRQNQIRDFMDRVCVHVMERFAPYTQIMDYIAYGGPRQTILQLQKRCPVLKSLEDKVLPPLDIPSPRQKVLETTISRIWSSCIIEWRED